MADTAKRAEIRYSGAEKHLIHMIRELKYGEVRVIVQDGKPVRAEEIKKSIVLGQDEK